MEQRVQELEQKLKKSEEQRQKLRENLKFFREKIALTHELVRKHAELQANAKKKDEELSQLRMARDGLQSQLEAVQTASEVTASVPIERQGSNNGDSMKALMARLDRVQQTSQDAKMAAQSAAASARNAEHETMNLQEQNTQLRDCIKDLESKHKVSAEELSRMKLQNAAAGDREHLKQRVDSLEHRLTAFTQQQQQAHEQLTQWQQAFGAFAQHIAPPMLGSTPASEAQQNGNRQHILEPQHREDERPSKKICREADRLNVKDSSKGSVPTRPEPQTDAEGTVMHIVTGFDGDHTSTGTVAGPDGSSPVKPSTAQALPSSIPLQECSSSRAVAFQAGVQPGHHKSAKQQPLQQLETGKVLESSASGTAVVKNAEQASAMDVVESLLTQLLDSQQPAEVCSNAAARLASAICSGTCTVPCVIAGFESTLLRCHALPGRRALSVCELSSDGASADVKPSSQQKLQPRQQDTVHIVLSCAMELNQRLEAAGKQQESLLMLLEQHLHDGALQEDDAWETDACILSAAAAQLYRLQHHHQAMAVLLYDMLMSQEEANAQLLLRVSAAVAAWPLPLQHSASCTDDLLGGAVLATVRDMCSEVRSKEVRYSDDAETTAGTDSGTSSATNDNPGIQQAARAISELVSLEWRQASGGAQQSLAGKWSSLKGVLDDALRMGLAMAESTQQGCIAEDQWHALACTVQLAVHCLGIGYCTQKAKEHGILDTLRAVMHSDKAPSAAGEETLSMPPGVEMELF